MGKDLFQQFPHFTHTASEILGYSIEDMCINDPNNTLKLTQYTQPALFVVNALAYFKHRDNAKNRKTDYAAGHSLGEYNALLSAEVFDFETGVQLTKKRGELMGNARGGAMAAVMGVSPNRIKHILTEHGLGTIDLVNFNTPSQTVIAGTIENIQKADEIFQNSKIRSIVLNVSGAFHSRYMKDAQKDFLEFLKQYTFNHPKIPIIANATARPYIHSNIIETLSKQIASPVLWTETIRYLMGKGEIEYYEIGSSILTRMVQEIKKTELPLMTKEQEEKDNINNYFFSTPSEHRITAQKQAKPSNSISAESLGSHIFRDRFNLRLAYLTGSMYRGISSADMVIKIGNAGGMGFFGAGGLSSGEIEAGIQKIQKTLGHKRNYGVNLLANYTNPQKELDCVNLFLEYKIQVIEASAYMQITPALVLYHIKGLQKNNHGKVICTHTIIAKVSRPEVAEMFMSPAPEAIVKRLRDDGSITSEQAELAKHVPMSHNICVEADSGGHTDMGIPTVLIPSIMKLKEKISHKYSYAEPICLGQAGGIGTPDAAAAAFIMGADFILTGSINQCTVEAGTSNTVKSMLQDIDVQDTEYAPAGDMFEMGSKVQVLKKGVFFPARAAKLYNLYIEHDTINDISQKDKILLEKRYFKKSFEEIWNEVISGLTIKGKESEIAKAEKYPKIKMAHIFRWYFRYSTQLALTGNTENIVDYQVQVGPALGAFNQWVKGSDLESWQNRHVDQIGTNIMQETARYLNHSYAKMTL